MKVKQVLFKRDKFYELLLNFVISPFLIKGLRTVYELQTMLN